MPRRGRSPASSRGFTVVVTKLDRAGRHRRRDRGDHPRARRPGVDVAVVSNPEFLREGAAIDDFKRPDRVVIGVEDERARAVMTEMYRPLNLNETPLMVTDRRTSELIKYASNAFLAMKITFINEMGDLCEKAGADVQHLARGIGLDKRIGSKFLHVGPGYGGSCFPKDTLALTRTARDFNAPLRLVETTTQVNSARKKAMAGKVAAALNGEVAGKTIAVLGLTFKPNTDDMRDSPALDIVPGSASGMGARASRPSTRKGREARSNCLRGVDFKDLTPTRPIDRRRRASIIITEWDQFRALDLGRVAALMRGKTVVDLRNIYRPDEMRRHGFAYTSLGRK